MYSHVSITRSSSIVLSMQARLTRALRGHVGSSDRLSSADLSSFLACTSLVTRQPGHLSAFSPPSSPSDLSLLLGMLSHLSIYLGGKGISPGRAFFSLEDTLGN